MAPTSAVAPTTAVASSAPPPATAAYDPSRPYWEQGNFAPVDHEVESFSLEVIGALPRQLDGLYVRNGANPLGGASAHWFLGDGMVHGVRLRGGRAEWYRNRWVDTPLLGQDLLAGGAGAPGAANNTSNTSVVHYAGRLLSLQEIGFPYELSASDLSTIGPWDMEGALTTGMTAHPKIDPLTGMYHFFGYGFTPPYLTYHVADAAGVLLSSQEVAVGGPTMIHDFAITDRDVVFWELPVLFSLDMALAGEVPFVWDPSYGARVGTFPLGGPASAATWVEIEPCYVFHGTNAWRDGESILIDVSRMPTMFAAGGDAGPNRVHRWRLDTSGGALAFSDDVIADAPWDLPTIDRRRTGRRHGHAWYATTRETLGGFDFAGIVHFEAMTGRVDAWEPPANESAGEALFVPDSVSAADGEGWLLAFGYDATDGHSDLFVLDATDCAAGPVARVRLPQRVPYGFHGCWVDGALLPS